MFYSSVNPEKKYHRLQKKILCFQLW